MLRRLSLYWLLAVSALGAYFPYLSLYLRENRGLTGTQVGSLFAVVPLVGTLCQPLWGQLADRSGARSRVLGLLCLGTAAGYVGLTLPRSYPGLLLGIGALALFSTAVQPAAMGVSMALLGRTAQRRFGHVRVWGTLGYLATVVALPVALDRVQARQGWTATEAVSEPGLQLCFFVAAALVLGAGLLALALPRTRSATRRAGAQDYRLLLQHGPYLRVLLFVFGVHTCLHGPMVMFPLYVRARGGDMTTISHLWIWMIALEIPLMLWSGAILQRLTPRWMVAGAAMAGGVRWLASAIGHTPAVYYPAQLMHALVVTGLLVGAPLCVEGLVPPRLRSTGQAGLTMVSAGAGALLSSLLAGVIVDQLGIDALYFAGGGGALLLSVTAPLLLPGRPTPATTASAG